MSIPKPDGRLSVVMQNEILTSPSSQPLIQQDEETSDCPLLTPSPPPEDATKSLENAPTFKIHNNDTSLDPTLGNINTEDGLAFLNLVNSSCKAMHDEPSSRDPMVETSSNSGSSSDTNEPVCTQLLTQLNTAYTHLAPDAQALFYNQDNGGIIPPLTGIQLMVPKPPKDYAFMSWNWPVIRKTFFWTLMSLFSGCIALAIGIIATMPKTCNPPVEWWQGSLFYEIFPASFQDAYKNDGIGDFHGITNRLEYLKGLGVKGVRLNSIYSTQQYPQNYQSIHSLTEIDPNLGTIEDFGSMLSSVHENDMALILDLPLYPLVKTLGEPVERHNFSQRFKREDSSILPALPIEATLESLRSAPAQPNLKIDPFASSTDPIVPDPLDDHIVTKAIKFWHAKGVDGFYLKGLEHYTNETNFVAALRYWKAIVGPNKILMCSEQALNDASDYSRNVILNRMDLIDVRLNVANGTKAIKTQVSEILKGILFEKAGYPWIHWSTGSIDTPRLASTLKVANASVAIAMMCIMLPGTPSIFYGDEIGMLNSASKDFQDLAHLYQLVPMRWDNQNSNDEIAEQQQQQQQKKVTPWMPESVKPVATNLTGLVAKLSELRAETVPIYLKAVLKNKEPMANCDIRYTADEVIVIERWYPRRNTYVFVANLGVETQTKDLSSLYYAGHVVVGPEHKINQNIYFKRLTIPPGEAFVIKLDK